MSVANLFNVPGNDEALLQFSFANAAEHHKIVQSLFDDLGIHVESFILDPLPINDPGAWLYQHQQAHNVQNAALGIAGNDLTSVDLKDKGQLAAWIILHGREHREASQLLNLN